MSINMTTVPPWKQALLEKKRKQDHEHTVFDDNHDRLSQMPTWKREILMKKQQQKNSMVFICKDNSSGTTDYNQNTTALNSEKKTKTSLSTLDNEHGVLNNIEENTSIQIGDHSEKEYTPTELKLNQVSDEHLLPIQENMWLRTDNFYKKPYSRSISNSSFQNDNDHGDGIHVVENEDEVFDEEVQYGRGFVHKLLRKFTKISTKEDRQDRSLSPKRSHSTDNLLDVSHKVHGKKHLSENSDSTFSPKMKAKSMDDLSNHFKPGAYSSPKVDSTAEGTYDSQSGDSSQSSPRNYDGQQNHVNENSVSHNGGLPEAHQDLIRRRHRSKENILVEELPQPNTVSSARSIFEKKAPQRRKEAPKPVSLYSHDNTDGDSYHRRQQEIKKTSNVTSINSTNKSQENSQGLQTVSKQDSNADGVILEESLQNIRAAGKSWHFSAGVDSKSQDTKKNTSDTNANEYETHRLIKPDSLHTQAQTNSSSTSYGSSNSAMGHKSSTNKDLSSVHSPVSAPSSSLQSQKKVAPTPPSSNHVISDNRNVTSNGPSSTASNKAKLHLDLPPLDAKLPPSANKNDSNKGWWTTSEELNRNKKMTKKNGIHSTGNNNTTKGPGSFLIGPASNVVQDRKNIKHVNINTYKDIKEGETLPYSKIPIRSYLAEEDIPVSNIDDFLGDDVPVTNIDDIALSPSSKRRSLHEGEPKDLARRRIQFEGAGVSLSKNLLIKTRVKKLKLTFNDAATSTYEYPSEQSLIASLPPEELKLLNRQNSAEKQEKVAEMMEPNTSLKSTPGLATGGGLANYKSKFQMDYQFGSSIQQNEEQISGRADSKALEPEEPQVKPADEEDNSAWSDAQSSDILF